MEQTLRRTSEERIDKKRKILKSFLVQAVRNPGEQYDDQLRFLKLLENIYGDHIRVLQALMETPSQNPGNNGIALPNFGRRLPDMDSDRIKDLVQQLNDLRVTNLTSPDHYDRKWCKRFKAFFYSTWKTLHQ